MKRFIDICVASLFLLAGCQHLKPVFNVDRNIPTNPSFTVIPRMETTEELEFSTEVEQYLIQEHLRVLRRPGLKAVETSNNKGVNARNAEQAAAASMSRTEWYYSLQDTDADYVLETSAQKGQLKLIRKATTEVLGFIELLGPNSAYQKPSEQISEMLQNVGIVPSQPLKSR